jgi:hypothetical protein
VQECRHDLNFNPVPDREPKPDPCVHHAPLPSIGRAQPVGDSTFQPGTLLEVLEVLATTVFPYRQVTLPCLNYFDPIILTSSGSEISGNASELSESKPAVGGVSRVTQGHPVCPRNR